MARETVAGTKKVKENATWEWTACRAWEVSAIAGTGAALSACSPWSSKWGCTDWNILEWNFN